MNWCSVLILLPSNPQVYSTFASLSGSVGNDCAGKTIDASRANGNCSAGQKKNCPGYLPTCTHTGASFPKFPLLRSLLLT